MKTPVKKLISAVLAVMLMLSLCAGIFSVSAAEEMTTVKNWNLILGEEIGAKFYVSVADSVSADAVMAVTDGYGTHNYPISAAQKDSNGNYIFAANLAAAQMADTITLQLHDGENVGTAHSYNVVDYADYILSGEYGDSTKALVKAMLNYGAAAQTYFNYNTENLANAGYESTETVEIPAVDASDMISGKVDGITFYGASMVFQSKVAVRFYFNVTGDINSYSFSTGELGMKNGMYYIEVADINPQDYANTITLTVNDALTVKYSPLTYISRMASSTNANMVNLVKAMYVYHQAAVSYVPDPVIRGQKIAPSTDLTIELGNTEVLETLSFDYKVTSGTFNISLNPDWDNSFGYFAFDANGNLDPYDGVTLETLEDGYIRVTFDLAALTKYSGNPSKALSFLYIRGGWTDATGYIDNVQYTVFTPTLIFDGGEFIDDHGLSIGLDNTLPVTKMSFDYKVTSGTDFVLALRPNWDANYYGNFVFNTTGNVDPYNGVTTETLENGYVRVYVDVTALNNIQGSQPSNVLTLITVHESWGDASGVIENIRINEAALQPPRGQKIAPSTDLTIELGNTKELATLSFDYKVTSGTFNISLNPDWDNSFGYFAFDANGNVDPYDGVTLETQEDGYIRVTFDMFALTKYSGSPSKALSFLYIRGGWTDATGYIDNVQYEVYEPTLVFEGGEFVAGTDLILEMNNCEPVTKMSFDYKITSGEAIVFALMPDWDNYYGYYAFDTTGSIDGDSGFSTQALDNGFVRVFVDVAALNKTSGSPSNVINTVYIRGAWTSANGIIENICINEAVEEPALIYEGGEIVAGSDLILELNNTVPVTKMSFDYKITSGEAIVFALMPDWDNYYGYYAFDANGSIDNDNGFVTEKLADGYIRVYVDVAALNKTSGSPSNVINIVYIRGAWTSANGSIENIRLNDSAYTAPRGRQISAGTDLTWEIANTAALTTLSFDYKVTSGTFNISLNPNWDNAFGYFAFDANGNVDPYDGVTVEMLDDGYYRVTFELNSLTKYNGAPSTALNFLYIRGAWTDATGYIDNIQFS